jgi:hypothetical protein
MVSEILQKTVANVSLNAMIGIVNTVYLHLFES